MQYKGASALSTDSEIRSGKLNPWRAPCRYADQLEGELMSELENGRLVRLMSKLGFINERPEYVFQVPFFCLRLSDEFTASVTNLGGPRPAIGTSSACSVTMYSTR